MSYFGRGIGANQPETDMRCALPNYREDLLDKPQRRVLIWVVGKAGNKQDTLRFGKSASSGGANVLKPNNGIVRAKRWGAAAFTYAVS